MDFGKCPRCGFVMTKTKAARQELQTSYSKAFKTWTAEETDQMAEMFADGYSFIEIGKALDRQPTAVIKRIEKLCLVRRQEVVDAHLALTEPTQTPTLSHSETAEEAEDRAVAAENARYGLA